MNKMEAKIYMELECADDGVFDVSDNYYGDGNSYIDAMRAEDRKYANMAYDFVSNFGNNVSSKTAKFHMGNTASTKVKSKLYAAGIDLKGSDGNTETVDNLITYCVQGDSPVFIFKFDMDSIDAEFEEELSTWSGEHDRVSEYKGSIGADKVWVNEPVRDFKMEFLNKANEKKYVSLEGCKLLQYDDGDGEYAVIVEKITLIDSLG